MARGRTASDPTEIPPKGWKDIAFRLKDEVAQDRVGLIAAGIAFYGLLALFPAITAVIAIAGLIAEPVQITNQVGQLAGLIPQEVTTIITDQATEVAGSREGGLGIAALIGVGIALWSASKGTSSLIQGLNAAYDEEETRGFFKKLITRLGLTLFIILGICTGLAVTMAVPAVTGALNAGIVVETLGSIVAYLLLFAMATVGLAVIYRYGPSRDNPEFAWVSPGALLACVMWVVASAGFAFYVGNFASYNETFGTLGGVVILLMWFWISAFIVLLGAELNAETEAQTRHDTTVGKDLPMGERDAVKADNLGEAETA
ncbi:YihY/virulence factor BrkB family protein [Roseobacter sp.]|uniref:YihY/virulence factor BrkB family protein n=1 Tax=Roseobacter sp. TaxID=1907202 RepID=UPI0025F05030|nr:YihY/virulence factor BrkB family protein [Roseobacter sp.]